MKVCDLTQFYSPRSGGVKRYVHEKIGYIENHSPGDEHILVVPGPKTEVVSKGRSRIYFIRSPLVSRTSRYRALLDLRGVEEIIERERPDIIESSDPYQIAWKSIAAGRRLGIPVVGFYHSHFPEAYLRGAGKYLGATAGEKVMNLACRYVGNLYNRFAATLVPSQFLTEVLAGWGVGNLHTVRLGVNVDVFKPEPNDGAATRESLGIPPGRKLLLYVGRLAGEKNTQTLFDAFALLQRTHPGDFHLLVVGDGPQRNRLLEQQRASNDVSWIQYCADSLDLARYYRAADLFVHPGVQETFGLVTLESQACGTPVLGIRGTYMDRIIFHEQEFWARENTVSALAEAIAQAGGKNLPDLGVRASEIAGGLYSWPRIFEQLFCIYREVCANYQRT